LKGGDVGAEGLSLKREKIIDTSLGKLRVSRPTLRTVAVLSAHLAKHGHDLMGALSSAEKENDDALGIKVALLVGQGLPELLPTVAKKDDGSPLSSEEVEELGVEDGINVLRTVFELVDRSALEGFRESVRSLGRER
jgi:hypothetical protein